MNAYDEQAWWKMSLNGVLCRILWLFMVKNLVGKPGNHELAESLTTNESIRWSIKAEKAERKIRNSWTENWAHFGRTR